MNNQLEFGLVAQPSLPAGPGGRRRVSRATWWFTQMRRVVDSAMDWSAQTPARPQQIPLPGTYREIQLSSR
jgi:hypothetical protein